MTTNGNGWNRFLVGILWAIILAFASTCLGGYLMLDNKIAIAAEDRRVNSERIVRLDECLSTLKTQIADVRADIKDVDKIVREVYRAVK